MTGDQKPLNDTAVRGAVESDAAQIAALLLELGYESDVTSTRERLLQLAASASDAVFVSCAGSDVLGVASLHLLPMFHAGGHVARLTALVVTKRSRRGGVGTALVHEAEAFATAHGCERLELTSGDHRADAHAFYEALGYQRVSQRFVRAL